MPGFLGPYKAPHKHSTKLSLTMGCFGNKNDADDDEEIPTPTLSSSSSASASNDPLTSTMSSTNSQFSALSCPDTLRLILQRLGVTDLARASCVCKVWNSVASDSNMLVFAFMAPWKLKEVIGKPANASFWRDNVIGKFAISHRIARGDTVASLAVKYSVQVIDIKRLNNMMSDHGIFSRERLLIPVSNPDILIDRKCYIELDTHAKREVAVLYLEGEPDRRRQSCMLNGGVTSEEGRRRIIDSLRRSMRVDDETAQYYLSISNGDPRAALSEFSEDLRWERQIGFA